MHSMHSIVRIFDLIPPERMNQRRDPERFTPRQVIAHLADWESVFRERMVGTIQGKPYEIKTFDEGQRAIDNAYHTIDVSQSLERFSSERLKTLSFIELLPAEAWNEMALHPEYGAITVMDQVQNLTAHDVYHIDQLLEYLKEETVGTW